MARCRCSRGKSDSDSSHQPFESRTDTFRMIRDMRDMARTVVLFAYECELVRIFTARLSVSILEHGALKLPGKGGRGSCDDRREGRKGDDSHGKHVGFPCGQVAGFGTAILEHIRSHCGRKRTHAASRLATSSHRSLLLTERGERKVRNSAFSGTALTLRDCYGLGAA